MTFIKNSNTTWNFKSSLTHLSLSLSFSRYLSFSFPILFSITAWSDRIQTESIETLWEVSSLTQNERTSFTHTYSHQTEFVQHDMCYQIVYFFVNFPYFSSLQCLPWKYYTSQGYEMGIVLVSLIFERVESISSTLFLFYNP